MPDERKLVTVLFADVVGSTTLGSENEPEVVRDVMARYFERMKAVAETYGGTVEKFIGDAVMVVFGVPRLHDDDAERAVRCALGMQEAMVSLNHELGMDLAVRVGVNSGRAVTGGGAEPQFLVTGDAVNVAARLQQGAEPGEIVAGQLTEELTRQAIVYRRRDPVVAKGKVEPITAFTVLRAHSALPRQARGLGTLEAPLVGRERELRLLLEMFARVRDERRAHLFTILGNAGVGKSRLVREALDRITEPSSARVLRGRCLPYGKGITYWPLIEILQQDAGIAIEDDRETTLAKLEKRLSDLVPAAATRQALRNRLTVVLGLARPAETLAEVPAGRVDLELAWAVRQYLQAIAAQGPLVAVIDDLQSAEPVVIQLLEHAAARVTEQPILLLCISRPELLETHPGWGAGLGNATAITLNPLSPPETAALISRLLEVDELPSELRQRLVERSEGNPLYCEEFLRMLIDGMRLVRVDDRWRAAAEVSEVRIPETIHALLAARLDTLPRAEKRTIEAASVVGERFSPEQVRALLPDSDVELTLEGLQLKGLVVEGPSATDTSELRFKHLLIRDVAYEGIPKNERAAFHERFERHLHEEAGDREAEFLEILAYHAERAFSLTRELRLGGDVLERRAARALKWNMPRAERALSREDAKVLATAVSMAQSAAEAAPRDDDVKLRLKLLEADSLRLAARFADALVAAKEAADLATQKGNQRAAAAAHLCASQIELMRGEFAAVHREANEAARLYRLTGDLAGEIDAEWSLVRDRLGGGEGWPAVQETLRLAERANTIGALGKAAELLGLAGIFATEAGHPAQAERSIEEATAIADQLGLISRSPIDLGRSHLARLRGDPAQAEQILRRSLEVVEDMGTLWDAITIRRHLAILLTDLARYDEADSVLEQALKDSEETGERWNRAEILARRALAAMQRHDLEAAERYARLGLESRTAGDGSGDSETHYALGQLRVAQGRHADAEAAFRQTLKALDGMGYSEVSTEFCIGIARFLAERGRATEATRLLDRAQAYLEAADYTLWLDEIARIRQLASTPSPS